MLALLAGGVINVCGACSRTYETNRMNISRDRAEDLQAIEQMHEADRRAAMASDIDALIDLWTDDGILLPPGSEPIVGKEAIARFLREGWDSNEPPPEAVEYTHDFSDIVIAGDWAFESGTFKSVWRVPGSETLSTQSGNLLRVLRRQPDGTWRAARAMWNLRDVGQP